ncbi:helix-turn-helix DNA-binding domain protein [Gordonia phage VanLee]|uniref:Helix-turn-helix DNA-binding domain protein n=1 Tax=Gordonia phage VanLee TaxID=2845816 RepID=A0A8F2DA96_9CAUD|nr:helix-turn-helix DNA-binding domain protein [Gordonia phage VanLee]QWS68209.1 helix-turn-helix DNA-binding domain protein [Gordonia phage VanLee]
MSDELAQGLGEANRQRVERAAARTVEQARAVLADPGPLSARHRRVLLARVRYPHAPLVWLGEHLGMSKDVYAGCLRRALADV